MYVKIGDPCDVCRAFYEKMCAVRVSSGRQKKLSPPIICISTPNLI